MDKNPPVSAECRTVHVKVSISIIGKQYAVLHEKFMIIYQCRCREIAANDAEKSPKKPLLDTTAALP